MSHSSIIENKHLKSSPHEPIDLIRPSEARVVQPHDKHYPGRRGVRRSMQLVVDFVRLWGARGGEGYGDVPALEEGGGVKDGEDRSEVRRGHDGQKQREGAEFRRPSCLLEVRRSRQGGDEAECQIRAGLDAAELASTRFSQPQRTKGLA